MIIERQITKIGGSHYILLTKDLMKYLELRQNEIVNMKAEEGKHGKFLSMWKKEEGDKTCVKKEDAKTVEKKPYTSTEQ